MEKDIKILIATHKAAALPNCKQFCGVQVGNNFDLTTLPKAYNITLKDSDGDNISNKNWFYCELTAQYYAYKNMQADYFGIMHYRRFFAFTDVKAKHSYTGVIIEKQLTDKLLDKYKIDSDSMQAMIEQYDAIVPKPFYYSMNLYQHYCMGHDIETFHIALKVIFQKYRYMWQDCKRYLKQNCGYFCNMFVFKANIFQAYSAWLFDILFETEKELIKRNSNPLQEVERYARLGGFIAERLCGIYIYHLMQQKQYKILQLPIVCFDKKYSFKRKVADLTFPLGSKRRKLLDNYIQKRIVKMRKKQAKQHK